MGWTGRTPARVSRSCATDGTDTEVLRILKDAEQAALNTLADHRAALDSLAKALVERETVDRSEVDAIVAQAEGSRASKPSR